MGRPRELPSHDPLDRFELLHEVDLRVETPRRVDDQDVDPPGLRGLHGVEDNGRGVGPLLLLDDGDAHPLAPHLELLDGGGPEGIGGGERRAATPALELACDLSDRRGLPRAVHADDHDRVEAVLQDLQGRLALLEEEVDVAPHDLPQDVGTAQIGSLRDHLHLVDELRGEGRPHVGRIDVPPSSSKRSRSICFSPKSIFINIAPEPARLAEPFLQSLEEDPWFPNMIYSLLWMFISTIPVCRFIRIGAGFLSGPQNAPSYNDTSRGESFGD